MCVTQSQHLSGEGPLVDESPSTGPRLRERQETMAQEESDFGILRPSLGLSTC